MHTEGQLRVGSASSRSSVAAVRLRIFRDRWSARANDRSGPGQLSPRRGRRSSSEVDRSFEQKTMTDSNGSAAPGRGGEQQSLVGPVTPDRRRSLNGCFRDSISAIGRCAMAASKVHRSLDQKTMAGGNGSAAPVRDFDERSPGSALDAGWHQIVVERPLWRSGHRARTPRNVSCTLRPVVADARFLMPDRPEVAGTGSSRRALQAVTGSSHIFGGGRLTGLAGDSRSRPEAGAPDRPVQAPG